jgi:hypothetical protein
MGKVSRIYVLKAFKMKIATKKTHLLVNTENPIDAYPESPHSLIELKI